MKHCLDITSPLQTDTDADGLGDACDPCPCFGGDDSDSDEVCACDPAASDYCAQFCAQHAGDNCPNVFNPGQENCNLEAETAREAEILKDACDPVPCPQFTPVMTSVSKGKSYFTSDMSIVQTLSHLDVTPIGSHDRYSTAQSNGVPVSTEVPTPVPATHYRYCPHDKAAGADCFDDQHVIDDAFLTGPLTYTASKSFWRKWSFEADFKWWHGTQWGSWVPDLSAAMKSNDWNGLASTTFGITWSSW